MAKRIGIIGNGNVGGALKRGFERAGHEVRAVDNDPAGIRAVTDWAKVVVLAVPFGAVGEVVTLVGSALDGKTVIDVTNALGPKMEWAVGFSTSGAEELQKRAPRAKVIKAFNTVFAQHMDSGKLAGTPLTALVAGDDAAAKAEVLELARDIGFESVDAGPLANARLIEPMAYLNIQLGYVLGLGAQIGFKLVRA